MPTLIDTPDMIPDERWLSWKNSPLPPQVPKVVKQLDMDGEDLAVPPADEGFCGDSDTNSDGTPDEAPEEAPAWPPAQAPAESHEGPDGIGEETHVQEAPGDGPHNEGQKKSPVPDIEIVDLPAESKKELIDTIRRNASDGQANELAGLEPSRVTVFKDYVCYYTDIDLIEASEFFEVDESGVEEAMISIREVLTRSMEKAPVQDLVKEAVLVGSEGYDAISAKEFTEAIIPVSREEICEIQRRDPALCELAKKMKGGEHYGKFLLVRKMLYKVVVYDGKICSPVVLPRELVEKCVKQHQEKLYAFLKQRFY